LKETLKKYKRKFDKTGVVRQLRARQQFTKPSVTNRIKKSRAIYKQSLQVQEEA
jgi:ribosomal protein S21